MTGPVTAEDLRHKYCVEAVDDFDKGWNGAVEVIARDWSRLATRTEPPARGEDAPVSPSASFYPLPGGSVPGLGDREREGGLE